MSGHGWVKENASGMKARCGGPGLCHSCNWELTGTRHPDTQEKMRWLLSFDHLPEGRVRDTSERVSRFAIATIKNLHDGTELTLALQKLIEAKDALVRQAIVDGEAGSQENRQGFTPDPSSDSGS